MRNVPRSGASGDTYLQLNGKEEECPQWGSQPGTSDARSLRQIGPIINRARYGRNDVIPSRAFDFGESSAGHTLENAMILADLASLAYFERDYVKKLLSLWGFERFHWIEGVDTDTQAFVTGKDAHLVVCFRGTSSKTDALTDIKFCKTTGPGGHGKVQRGFNGALDSVWDELHTAGSLMFFEMLKGNE